MIMQAQRQCKATMYNGRSRLSTAQYAGYTAPCFVIAQFSVSCTWIKIKTRNYAKAKKAAIKRKRRF